MGIELFKSIKSGPFECDKSFRWKTNGFIPNYEQFLEPKEMETSHLFYILRMVWNNSCPEAMRIGKVKLYRFGPHYTSTYMANAVYHIGNELGKRELESWMEAELNQMAKNWWNYLAAMKNGIEK